MRSARYTLRHQQQCRVQQARSAVRSCDHDGLQPVPDASAAQVGVRRHSEEAQRHRAQARRQAGVLHVMGLCRQAGDDGGTRRGLYHAPPTTTTPSSFRPASPSHVRSKQRPELESLCRRQAAPERGRAPISPPRPSTPRCSRRRRSGWHIARRVSTSRPRSCLQTVAWDTVQDYFRTVQAVAKVGRALSAFAPHFAVHAGSTAGLTT